jgi:glycosyltransferase involved in cell wall biosynthesis
VFAGSLSDPLGAYAAADIFVFPSRGGDSMPAALIEAGLCGLPAVATDVQAIPEIVVEGRTGWIVAPNVLSPLVEAIRALLTDPEQAASFGAAARARCLDRFDVDTVAGQWLRVLTHTT